MNQQEITAALGDLREAREEWRRGQTEFRSAYSTLVSRLIYEAMSAYMNEAHVAAALGVTRKTIRSLMRSLGLDPRGGQRALNAKASDALLENAALMGIDPSEMDLTSPLAYLPMGKDLRKQLQDRTVRLADLDEGDETVSGNDPNVTDEMDVECPHCGREFAVTL